jgi:hypothetical protein
LVLRSRIGAFLGIAVMVVLTTIAGAGVSSASADRAEFVAQARSAGLSVAQANGLQAKVDDYLVKTGGTQVSPNQIDLGGAVLGVSVPGESQPRRFGDEIGAYGRFACDYQGAPAETFCAYKYEGFFGEYVQMYDCGTYRIPWGTTGSWINNQTPGTVPVLTFWNDSKWHMPAPYSDQYLGVDWHPVISIKNC